MSISEFSSGSTNRSGVVLLLTLLVIVVVCGLLWFEPSALFRKSDPELPWNQESRLVGPKGQVAKPIEQQPKIEEFISLKTETQHKGRECGEVSFLVKPNGRIEGGWSGEFNPREDTNYMVMGAGFKGNIDPSKIYSDDSGEDRSKLFFIAKGKFLIVETDEKKKNVRKAVGDIYVTGWIDSQYKVTGELLITSNKRTFEKYLWQGKLSPKKMHFD